MPLPTPIFNVIKASILIENCINHFRKLDYYRAGADLNLFSIQYFHYIPHNYLIH